MAQFYYSVKMLMQLLVLKFKDSVVELCNNCIAQSEMFLKILVKVKKKIISVMALIFKYWKNTQLFVI